MAVAVKINQPDRVRFERMAVLLANFTGASACSEFPALPCNLRRQYEMMDYTELIRPLVWRDRFDRSKSWGQISRYYGITEMQARTIINRSRRAPFCCGETE